MHTACALTAAFTCRQLSYTGAEFELTHVQLESMFQLQYSRSANFWQLSELVLLMDDVFGPKLKMPEQKGSKPVTGPRKLPLGGMFRGSHQCASAYLPASVLAMPMQCHVPTCELHGCAAYRAIQC